MKGVHVPGFHVSPIQTHGLMYVGYPTPGRGRGFRVRLGLGYVRVRDYRPHPLPGVGYPT